MKYLVSLAEYIEVDDRDISDYGFSSEDKQELLESVSAIAAIKLCKYFNTGIPVIFKIEPKEKGDRRYWVGKSPNR